jgi:hypothetical protein
MTVVWCLMSWQRIVGLGALSSGRAAVASTGNERGKGLRDSAWYCTGFRRLLSVSLIAVAWYQ